MKTYKIVTIIPAYNEERRGKIYSVIKSTKKYADKVIVIDDGSTDNTSKIAKRAGAKVIRYKINQGLSYATHLGIKEALKGRKDVIIIILDADGQHNPKHIPEFVSKIEKGYDYVYGKRNISNYPLIRRIGNFGLSTLTNLLCPTKIKDTECGYRAFTSRAAKKIKLYYKKKKKRNNKPKWYVK